MGRTLIPFRALWRDAGTLQFGTDPDHAIVLTGLPAGTADVLALLDGAHSDEAVRAAGAEAGLSADEVDSLLAALERCSAVTDRDPANDLPGNLPVSARRQLRGELATLTQRHGAWAGVVLSRRIDRRVVLTGDHRFVVPLATVLAASGVRRLWIPASGRVRIGETMPSGLRAIDERQPRGTAIAEVVLAAAPDADLRPFPNSLVPDLTVVAGPVGAPAPDLPTPARKARARLELGVRDGLAVVGPLTVPGRTACPTCVELARTDRDPDWPALAAQLGGAPTDPCSVANTLAAVALAGAQILEHLDGGRPAVRSASLELAASGAIVRRRQWDPHPACPCTSPSAA
ncbi:hypothetical protein [Fodinicola acaciae]|uniref:hypothetical protein n=1 Tax=Fodinicola acaciae TaxID=2681555 RepID=UPI0013D0901A|nr:hypothetical protein [Fodinicola acaciae]